MAKRIIRPKKTFLYIAWILVGLGVSIVAGCNWRALTGPTSVEPGLAPAESKKYAEAVGAYNAKSYDQSAQKFTALREQTANPAMARMALYGLACTRLMQANTPKEYQEAIALWNTWVQSAPKKNPEYEDPALLAPLLAEKMLFSHIPLGKEDLAPTAAEPSVPQWLLVRANQELQRLKGQLDATALELEARDKRIKSLEKEIERLNQQIKAFESIDQKIQKKKNAIPSAE
jgi:TolA-binding protein